MVGVHWWGSPNVRWGELLYGKSRLEVFGISVGTLFEGGNSEHVRDFLEGGGHVHVVLGDPRSHVDMARYDKDFQKSPGDRFKKVVSTLEQLDKLRTKLSSSHKSRLTIALTDLTFKYSAYRIDEDVLFVPYRMIPGKQTSRTPALAFDRNSTLVTFYLKDELEALKARAAPLNAQMMKEIRELASA